MSNSPAATATPPPPADRERISCHTLFHFLPLLKVRENEQRYRLLLFAFLPLVTALKRPGVTRWRLFGCIPLLKVRTKRPPNTEEKLLAAIAAVASDQKSTSRELAARLQTSINTLTTSISRQDNRVQATQQLLRSLHEKNQAAISQLLKLHYQEQILHCKEAGTTPEKTGGTEVIISLTTYSKRIHNVPLAIESCMQQTRKANRIILWLDESFRGTPLPAALQRQQERGLTIGYCEDLKSYKKLIPTLERYPEAAIITVDDDAIYDPNMVDRLVRAWQENPHCIHCGRMHRITYSEDGNLLPYRQWEWLCRDTYSPDERNFPTGVAGTLYPPHSLAVEVFNKKVFMELCPHGDDIWFKAMACLAGYPASRVYTGEPGFGFTSIDDDQDIALWLKNVNENQNDAPIHAVFSRYGLIERLKPGKARAEGAE